ncbi:hypothetical protein [Streptosporangium roseum]|uniref:hypothetical protein n=1 Tax=Streptosporangium roseum TaxID=2001 RepID=UPI0004CCA1CB|nr:hypothetical protein [Streptosporangium roseum]
MAALQDPRKDVLSIRNLFPDKIALRLDASEQVGMVLGDGSRDRGALADLISPDPDFGTGIACARMETLPNRLVPVPATSPRGMVVVFSADTLPLHLSQTDAAA